MSGWLQNNLRGLESCHKQITIEHHLTNLLFLLYSLFFCPFVPYCFTSTVSSTPSKSHKILAPLTRLKFQPGCNLITSIKRRLPVCGELQSGQWIKKEKKKIQKISLYFLLLWCWCKTQWKRWMLAQKLKLITFWVCCFHRYSLCIGFYPLVFVSFSWINVPWSYIFLFNTLHGEIEGVVYDNAEELNRILCFWKTLETDGSI